MFREYTEEGCLFECKLRKAANYSQCIPWDYPVPNGLEDMDICTTYDMFDDTKTLKGSERPKHIFCRDAETSFCEKN